MKLKSVPVLSVGILALLLLALFLGRSPRPHPAVVINVEHPEAVLAEAPLSQMPAPQSPAHHYSTYQWRVGDRACWQFSVSMRISSEPENIAGGEETRVGGTLQMVVMSVDSQRVTLAAALSDTWFDCAGQRVRRYEEFFNKTPAILTVSPVGQLVDLALPRHIPADDRNLLRLAYGWEFVARPEAAYQVNEGTADASGSYFRASYRRPNETRIHKTRLFQSATASHEEALQYIVASEFTGTIGPVWVSGFSGWEDSIISLDNAIVAASRIAVSLRMETNAPPLAASLANLLSDPRAAVNLSSDPDPAAKTESISQLVRREALAARWATVPFAEVLLPVQAVAGRTMQEQAEALQDFEDWLTAHPDRGPAQIVQTLHSLPTEHSSLSALLVSTLAEAGTTQGRHALAALLQAVDAFPPSTVIQAAVAAGDFAENTPPALKETLAGLMSSPLSDGSYRMSDTAFFSLARIAKDDLSARDYIAHQLEPWLQANADPNDTVKALHGMANAGLDDPPLLEQAMSFARSADADIRLAVAEYLNVTPQHQSGPGYD